MFHPSPRLADDARLAAGDVRLRLDRREVHVALFGKAQLELFVLARRIVGKFHRLGFLGDAFRLRRRLELEHFGPSLISRLQSKYGVRKHALKIGQAARSPGCEKANFNRVSAVESLPP